MKLLVQILILIGSGVISHSIFRFHKLIEICKSQSYQADQKGKHLVYYTALSMMYMFAMGYLAVFWFVSATDFAMQNLFVALIFFFGALFVATMIQTLWTMNARMRKKNEDMMEIFVTSLEMKDYYTIGHSKHVHDIVALLFDHLPPSMKAGRSRLKLLDAAILHDIGKIWVVDHVLNKPGALNNDEWEVMRLHPLNGKRILENTIYAEISDWVYYHHERMDGRGYYKLKGEEIPFESRMICIADTFSALTTNRPYRKGFSYEKALSIVKEGAGTQFDADLLEVFTSIPIEEFEAIQRKEIS